MSIVSGSLEDLWKANCGGGDAAVWVSLPPAKGNWVFSGNAEREVMVWSTKGWGQQRAAVAPCVTGKKKSDSRLDVSFSLTFVFYCLNECCLQSEIYRTPHSQGSDL